MLSSLDTIPPHPSPHLPVYSFYTHGFLRIARSLLSPAMEAQKNPVEEIRPVCGIPFRSSHPLILSVGRSMDFTESDGRGDRKSWVTGRHPISVSEGWRGDSETSFWSSSWWTTEQCFPCAYLSCFVLLILAVILPRFKTIRQLFHNAGVFRGILISVLSDLFHTRNVAAKSELIGMWV